MAKAAYWTMTDVEARKRGGKQVRYLVVHAVNDDYWSVGKQSLSVPQQTQ